jgi:hypothetical protein
MGLDRVGADEKFIGNLLVFCSYGDHGQYLGLPPVTMGTVLEILYSLIFPLISCRKSRPRIHTDRDQIRLLHHVMVV